MLNSSLKHQENVDKNYNNAEAGIVKFKKKNYIDPKWEVSYYLENIIEGELFSLKEDRSPSYSAQVHNYSYVRVYCVCSTIQHMYMYSMQNSMVYLVKVYNVYNTEEVRLLQYP